MWKQTLLSLSMCVMFSSSEGWTDPVGSPSLTVTPEPGDVLAGRAGDEVHYTCSFNEHPGYQYSVNWFHAKGNIDYEMKAEIDEAVTLMMRLTEADNNTVLYCKAFKRLPNSYWAPILNSKAIKVLISSSGHSPLTEGNDQVAPTLTLTPAPGDAEPEHSEGEEVEFSCRARTADIVPWIKYLYWQQVKGNSEMTRTYSDTTEDSINVVTESTLKTNLTIADDNTKLYCWMWAEVGNKLTIVRSDYITIRVRSGDVAGTTKEYGTQGSTHQVTEVKQDDGAAATNGLIETTTNRGSSSKTTFVFLFFTVFLMLQK